MQELLGQKIELGDQYPNGSNIYSKINDASVSADPAKSHLIREIAAEYLEWRNASLAVDESNETEFVSRQVELFQHYRNLLDEERVDVFDSRGALQPSALEEFCYYLFRPLLSSVATELAVGHHEVYQGMYFSAQNFADFSKMPTARFPVGNLDFVIGKRIQTRLATDGLHSDSSIVIPAVAIECKTYLDRPRWIESDVLASRIKHGFPRCLYIVISEFLKLDLAKVDVLGSRVDHVYVFRRAQNVDRRIRRAGGAGLAPLYVPAVLDFFHQVKRHLSDEWSAAEDWMESGIIK